MNHLMAKSRPSTCEEDRLSGQNDAFIFESLVCDFQWTGLEVGAIAGLMNASQRASSTTLGSWKRLLCDHGAVAQLGLLYADGSGLSTATSLEMGRFYQELSKAKSGLRPLLVVSSRLAGAGAERLSRPTEAWRSLAMKAAHLLDAMEASVRERLATAYSENSRILRALLEDVAAGGSRCVDENEGLILPRLAQKRRSARAVLDVECIVVADGQGRPARLRDASRDGIGISCEYPLSLEQGVTLKLNDGRSLNAAVVWSSGQRAGLRLLERLATDDGLLNL